MEFIKELQKLMLKYGVEGIYPDKGTIQIVEEDGSSVNFNTVTPSEVEYCDNDYEFL